MKTSCGVRFFSSGPGKVGRDKLHRIGSISKTFLGPLMLILEKEGRLRLDDTAARWVDGVPNGARITIRQLLTHRSGLFNCTNDPAVWPVTVPRHWTPEELLAVVRRNTPDFAPGEGWAYSNTNFVVLGMIAEAAGGARLGALIRSRLLEPMNLRQTFFGSEESFGTLELARGFDVRGQDVTNLSDLSWAWGAGAIVATPTDLVEWIDRIAGGTFFDAPTQQKLLAPSKTETEGVNIGLGIFLFDEAIGRSIGHGGWVDGYQSLALHYPQKHATVVAIVDTDVAEESQTTESDQLFDETVAELFAADGAAQAAIDSRARARARVPAPARSFAGALR